MLIPDRQHIATLVKRIFSKAPLSIEHVPEGISTYVYRIIFQHSTFYLRILPEDQVAVLEEDIATFPEYIPTLQKTTS